MAWRVARSLETLRSQINAVAPNRDTTSDGTIGDAAHAARASDHNPNAQGVVTAYDIDHDPAGGMDTYKLAEILRQNKDPRIEYVISNGRIFNSRVAPWQWRDYTGSNKHDKHMHISVHNESELYDDPRAWAIGATIADQPGMFSGITATVFGGPGDEQPVAYSDVQPGWASRPGVALPYRFPAGPRPIVRVTHQGKSVDCPVVDVGPWNTNDVAYVLSGQRPQAETGTDLRGRRTNLAGIDLTPAAAEIIDLPGKGLVEWRFLIAQDKQEKPSVATDTIKISDFVALLTAFGEGRVTITPATPSPAVATPQPAPVVVAPAPTPALQETGVGFGAFSTLAVLILQMLGVLPGSAIAGETATQVGNVLPLVTAGISAVGATGFWGPVLQGVVGILGSLFAKK